MAATTKINVEITSYALSTLFGDNANCDGDQEGFLFGEVFTRKGRDITDQDADGSVLTTVIRITSHMFLFEPCEFYNAVGKIDENKIKETLGPFVNNVVGYFDFKRAMPMECSTLPGFRMTFLFRNLVEWSRQRTTPLTLLVLRQNHLSSGTIGNNYCFYHLNDSTNKLVKIASEIPNLGDTSHRQYIHLPSIPSVDNIIKKYLSSGPTQVEEMPVVKAHKAMMSELEKAAGCVNREERKYWEAQQKYNSILQRAAQIKSNIAELLTVQERDQQEQKTTLSRSESSDECKDSVPVTARSASASVKNSHDDVLSEKSSVSRNAQDNPSETPPTSRKLVVNARPQEDASDMKEEIPDNDTQSANANTSPILTRRRGRK